MAYKCLECGHIFEEGEEKLHIEPHGEEWHGCPRCGGSYQETERCEICGSEHLEEELNCGICEECIDDHKHDFAYCYEISAGETEEISINALLASLLDASDIEQILIEHIKERCPDIDCSKFIDYDRYWFAQRMKEVRK